jgi:hypothetical protein
MVLAAHGRLDRLRLPYLVVIALTLISALPGIVTHLRRNHEPWLEEWRRSARR